MRARVLLIAALFPVVAWGHASLQSFSVTGSTDLFTSVGAQQVSNRQDADSVWPVTVNLPLLYGFPATVNLNLPDRPAVTIKRTSSEQRGANGFIWTGHGADCVVFLRQAESSFRGQAVCKNAGYDINKVPNGSGLQLARTLAAPGETQSDVATSAAILPLQPQQPGSPTQVDTVIDILVLYTEAVRQAKDPGGGKVETLLLAQDAVDQTQEALNNSTPGFGMTTNTPIAKVNLIAAKKVSRTFTGNFSADLLYLETDPEVSRLRDFWAADVVMYLTTVGTTNYSGLSNQPDYTPTYPPGPNYAIYADSALLYNCALMVTDPGQPCFDTSVFPHEFAHNLGANHDPLDSPWAAPPYPTSPPMPVETDAFGHYGNVLSTGDGFHTVMSYLVSSGCHSPCPRILYYSNPNVTTDVGFKTGVVGTRNNAAVIQAVAPTTAQYRLNVTRIFYDGFEDN